MAFLFSILPFLGTSSSAIHRHLDSVTWTSWNQHSLAHRHPLSALGWTHHCAVSFSDLAFGFDFFVTPPKFLFEIGAFGNCVGHLIDPCLASPRLFPGLGSTRFCDGVSITTTIVATTAPTTLTLDMGYFLVATVLCAWTISTFYRHHRL